MSEIQTGLCPDFRHFWFWTSGFQTLTERIGHFLKSVFILFYTYERFFFNSLTPGFEYVGYSGLSNGQGTWVGLSVRSSWRWRSTLLGQHRFDNNQRRRLLSQTVSIWILNSMQWIYIWHTYMRHRKDNHSKYITH